MQRRQRSRGGGPRDVPLPERVRLPGAHLRRRGASNAGAARRGDRHPWRDERLSRPVSAAHARAGPDRSARGGDRGHRRPRHRHRASARTSERRADANGPHDRAARVVDPSRAGGDQGRERPGEAPGATLVRETERDDPLGGGASRHRRAGGDRTLSDRLRAIRDRPGRCRGRRGCGTPSDQDRHRPREARGAATPRRTTRPDPTEGRHRRRAIDAARVAGAQRRCRRPDGDDAGGCAAGDRAATRASRAATGPGMAACRARHHRSLSQHDRRPRGFTGPLVLGRF